MHRPISILLALLGHFALQQHARAVVIDDFNTGPATSSPALPPDPLAVLDSTQEGLPNESVIGDVRNLYFLHSGDASVGQEEGVLRINYDQGWFEVGILDYSRSTLIPPLDANLVTSGEDHLVLRIARSDYQLPTSFPATITFGLSSGEESGTLQSDFVSIPLPDSTSAYTIAVELTDFAGVDLTDIDQIYIGFGLVLKPITLELDEIVTSTLVPGDLNTDGLVNAEDYASFNDLFGFEGYLAADANRDGVVNAADYTVWRDARDANLVTVPEPAGLVIAGALVLGLPRHRVTLLG